MKEVFDMLFNAENIRMLIILAVSVSGFVWLNAKTDRKLAGLELKFEELSAKFTELKINDFAHLTNAFKALTFVLRENNTMTEEQQKYIDSML